MSTLETSQNEWDTFASIRYQQISSGKDITYRQFLLPELMKFVSPDEDILDVGCGIGYGTSYFSKNCNSIIGIDPSSKSIQVAKSTQPQTNFLNCSLNDYTPQHRHTFIILNMVLHNSPSISTVLSNLSRLLPLGGTIAISMCHPSYWLKYKNINENNSHDPSSPYEIPFTISKDRSSLGNTSYYQRSKATYRDNFAKIGARIVEDKSPIPDSKLMNKYPKKWEFPRYWFVKLSLS